MSDNITLPREVVEAVLYALVSEQSQGGDDCYADSITALRTAIAAEPTKQEPVAWVQKWAIDRLTGQMGAVPGPVTWGIDAPLFTCAVHHSVPLYTAPPALAAEQSVPTVKESLTHPGYIIGSHWLETAYSRVCAGEAEADVLRDCGWERVDEALRRDAERYRWLRERAWFQFEFEGRYGDSGETVQELDAAIDAAMENKR